MGITCKPSGKFKSVMTKMQNEQAKAAKEWENSKKKAPEKKEKTKE